MKYMGSKNRHAKHIIPFIELFLVEGCVYIEPFVGGANLIDKVKWDNKIGNDINHYLIALLKELQNGWEPLIYISEDRYNRVKNNKDAYPDYFVGYVGFCLSYAAQFFKAYSKDHEGKQNYSLNAFKNVTKQAPNLKGIDFVRGSYTDLEIQDNAVVYCDPPYAGTEKYKTGNFDIDHFWQWARELSARCLGVFVSSHEAPADFVSVWSKDVNVALKANRGADGRRKTEHLFMWEGMT